MHGRCFPHRYYAHSVCLVRGLVTGQLPAVDCAATARVEMSHNDYGNTATATVLSGEELSLITQASGTCTRLTTIVMPHT